MIEVPIFNQNGEKVDTIQVDEAKLGGEVRTNLLKQALVMYHANQRQGTVRTQARGEVAGSTRKMFRQKGTGNARTGGIRNPIKKSAAVTPSRSGRRTGARRCRRRPAGSPATSAHPRQDPEQRRPRRRRRSRSTAPRPSRSPQMFKALGIDRSVPARPAPAAMRTLEKSARNIDRTTLTTVDQLNAWDILQNRTLLVTRTGWRRFWLEHDEPGGSAAGSTRTTRHGQHERHHQAAGHGEEHAPADDAQRVRVPGARGREQARRSSRRSRRSTT